MRSGWLCLLIGLSLAATVVGSATAAPAPDRAGEPVGSAQVAPHGAGLIVRHGDGRQVIAYVTFNEPRLNGLELLQRAGLKVVTAPAGFGQAVCSIEGEGCPADNCFCQSYGRPALYWRYYQRSEGRWVYAGLGPSSRALRDGDIDGWEWSGEPPRLPDLTIEAIAARAGIARPARAATPSPPPPTATVTAIPPIPTSISPATQPPLTATSRPAPTARPATAVPTRPVTATSALVGSAGTAIASPVPATLAPATATPPPAVTPVATSSAFPATPTASPTAAAVATGSTSTGVGAVVAPTGSLGTAATEAPPSPTSAPAPSSPSPVVAMATAGAVVIAPDGQVGPLPTPAGAPVPWLGYGAVGAVGLGLLAYLLISRRRAAGEDER